MRDVVGRASAEAGAGARGGEAIGVASALAALLSPLAPTRKLAMRSRADEMDRST